ARVRGVLRSPPERPVLARLAVPALAAGEAAAVEHRRRTLAARGLRTRGHPRDPGRVRMAATDYSTYLRIDELLDLQHPLTAGAHDELLFVVIHQAYELWFKVILHELDLAVSELEAGRAQGAIAPLHRTTRIDELLI